MAINLTRRVQCALIRAADAARAQGHREVTAAHVVAAFLDDPGSIVGRTYGQTSASALIRATLAAAAAVDAGAGRPATTPIGPLDLEPAARLAVHRAARDAGDRAVTTADVVVAALLYPPDTVARLIRACGVDADELLTAVRSAIDLGEREDDGARTVGVPPRMPRPLHEDVLIGMRHFIVASPA
ncbi:MAG TPA: Clp protease N-terminal domain-containing protein [Micromonosporaceae bacterium]